MAYGKNGLFVQVLSDRTVRWVQKKETGYEEVRLPKQKIIKPSLFVSFTVDGKQYPHITDLCAEDIDAKRRHFQDIFGQDVLDMKERYPCFDSYDFATENRYFHWYLILSEARMSQVYYDDGNRTGEITEDIEKLHYTAYSTLNFWHYLDKDGILLL